MFIAAAVALLLGPQLNAADYFPLVKGTRWTYVMSGAKPVTYVDEVGDAVKAGAELVYPIATHTQTAKGDKVIDTIYYSTAGDTAFLIQDPASPILDKRVVFKLDAGKGKWSYTGMTDYEGVQSPLKVDGVAKFLGQKTILGNPVDTVEVTINAEINVTEKTKYRTKQSVLYAKGIGMCSMRQTGELMNVISESTMNLTKYEPGVDGQK